MHRVVIHGPGDLHLGEIEAASVPGMGEVRIAVSHGGICGSDLRYHRRIGIGAELGRGVTGLAGGDRVAVTPSCPCGSCGCCLRGLANHCLDLRFSGSDLRIPHEQGQFRTQNALPAAQLVRLSHGAELALAAWRSVPPTTRAAP